MYGEGQGNGYEIKDGQLVPCTDTFADGFLYAKSRAEAIRAETAEVEEVGTVEEFLERTPGVSVEYVEADREPTGLDA